jgi:CheY-like chemotaxis protein
LNKRTFKVLVFDRDSDALITLQHALENAGLDTTITWDEAEIRNLVADVAFDVILAGDYPPGFTVQAIRDDVESRSVSCPCLALAASDGEAEHFFELGITGVVSKRDPSEVLEQVHRLAYSKVA